MKEIISCVLLLFLVICAVAVSFSKKLLNSILIFMSYSLIMSILWILLESPDLGITEAAVGAGITSVLFFVTLKKIHAMSGGNDNIEEEVKPDMEKNGGMENQSPLTENQKAVAENQSPLTENQKAVAENQNPLTESQKAVAEGRSKSAGAKEESLGGNQ